jgi:uncharacterized LabA/DUF88 family protein
MPLYSAPAQPTSYMFVDGDNLRVTLSKMSDRVFGGVPLPIEWKRLRGSHRKVFYYDEIPVQQHQEDDGTYAARVAPKRTELATIERQAGFHVRSGDAVHRKRRGNEQKMVDVQLAVDALLMASRGLFESVTLVTGDLDFKPLVTALVDMGVDVHLQYPPGETSEDLLAAADRADPIKLPTCLGWLDSAFNAAHPMPKAHVNFKDHEYDNAPDLVSWNDLRYGHCRVVRRGVELMLISEHEPNNPDTHRLEITDARPELIRIYAQEVFGLEVPAW